MFGSKQDTSWMIEDLEEGFEVKRPTDKFYEICEIIAKEGFFKAMSPESNPTNSRFEAFGYRVRDKQY
jgi:hypothetical protein